jgi:hypothetical protein
VEPGLLCSGHAFLWEKPMTSGVVRCGNAFPVKEWPLSRQPDAPRATEVARLGLSMIDSPNEELVLRERENPVDRLH